MMRRLPFFRYQPNAYANGSIINEIGVCDCCGLKTTHYIPNMYAEQNIKCICLVCAITGKAAQKFDGTFIQDAEEILPDKDKTEELFKRTPGYLSWQGENWLVCCDDYCAFIGPVGAQELQDMGIFDDVTKEYADKWNVPNAVFDDLSKTGSPGGYLFQCLHCKKYHLDLDYD